MHFNHLLYKISFLPNREIPASPVQTPAC